MSVTEKEIQAITVAPRVTEEDVLESIVKEEFLYTATLTFCVLTLVNGWTVTGESACASPANYNKEIGDRLAKENAIGKIWGFLGYNLKEKLHLIEKTGPATGAIHNLGSPVTYIGTKVIHAVLMDRQAYNDLRGWKLPEDENGEDLGYLIEDTASDSNVPGFTGYVSWSPRGLFEKSYGTGVRQAPLTFLDRMKAEHAELVERYNKLTEFTLTPAFKNIPHIEQVDLKEQARHMLKYGLVLGKRIERNSQ